MDYLDPRKELKDRITLLVGYVLVAVAIAFASLVLLYQAFGFSFGKNGNVIQNGLLFFSSQPNPATIYVNGTRSSYTTNTRLFLPSGIYQIKLTRSGYRDWQRRVTVDGGSVEHFDYPLLIPKSLVTSKISTYAAAPEFMSESPNKNFLLIGDPGNLSDLDLYNISNPAKPVLTSLTLPTGILSTAAITQSWQVVGWADDNQHVLLEHLYDGKSEYIMVDINNISQSVNLNNSLTNSDSPSQLTLNNEKYNNYYLYNNTTDVLSSASLSSPTLTPVLSHVLAYDSYGNKEILYVTDQGAKAGKVLLKLDTGNNSYTITSLPASSGTYLLDLTTYSGTLYVAVGSSTGSQIFIYEDPVGQLSSTPGQALAPSWVLHVDQPNYLSFSNNAQFIMAENAYNYATYDVENQLGYLYSDPKKPLDSPQLHASWMDGDRLVYVSNGKIVIQDYDNNNQQTLVPSSSLYVAAFSSNYHYMYSLDSSGNAGQYNLQSTPLLTPSDL